MLALQGCSIWGDRVDHVGMLIIRDGGTVHVTSSWLRQDAKVIAVMVSGWLQYVWLHGSGLPWGSVPCAC